MKKLALLSFCSLLLLPGCFDIETNLVLKKDLSGTAGLSLTIDMEPMVYVMATMAHAFSGEEGPPTEEELAEVRDGMMVSIEEDEEEMSDEEMWREAAEELPEGFELLEMNMVKEGLVTRVDYLVAFPHISRLHELKLSEPGREKAPMPGEPSVENFDAISDPFAGFQFIDEGDTYLLQTRVSNPVDEARESGMGMEGLDEMLESVFANLQLALTIQVPGEVVEHNATRTEGKNLIWEFNMETIRSGSVTDLEYLMVRFKK